MCIGGGMGAGGVYFGGGGAVTQRSDAIQGGRGREPRRGSPWARGAGLQPFSVLIGGELEGADAGRCELQLPVTAQLRLAEVAWRGRRYSGQRET
jgi:hypothetical protein